MKNLYIALIVGLFAILKFRKSPLKEDQQTLPDDDLEFKAQLVSEAFDPYNDDEQAIYDALTGVSLVDFDVMSNFFGIQKFKTITGETEPLTLPMALKYFLNNSELKKLISYNPNLEFLLK